MHDFELDDDFWPGVLGALREDTPVDYLGDRWPAFAELVEGLVADAEREPILVGFRLATHGRNPRLFAVLTGALLARSRIPTLVLDLSPDTRWLEQLLGADYKEGFVDHVRFGAPLAQCTRETGLDGLWAMSGGTWFLAGSPLDDAPGFRAGLEELRRHHGAVIVTLPPPLEAGDRTGIAALCGALVTVEERGTDASLAGSERAVVRLKGNTDAARDLAHLTHHFLGPLPVLLGAKTTPVARQATSTPIDRKAIAGRSRSAVLGATAAERARDEDLLFLQGFEGPRPGHSGSSERRSKEEPNRSEEHSRRSKVGRSRRSKEDEQRSRFRPRPALFAAALIFGAIVIVGIVGHGVAFDVVRGLVDEPDRSYPELEGGETIALDPVPGSATETLPVDTVDGLPPSVLAADSILLADTTTLAGSTLEDQQALLSRGAGRPAPFSVHVGSYQSARSALRVVEGVEAMGYPATLSPVTIPGKGQWFRIYAGSFADSTEAMRARDRLQASDLVDEGVVRSAPWTFEIGTYPSLEAARGDAAALRERGIAAYPVGREPVRLYAGAYQSREEAELLAHTLQSVLESRSARLIVREE
ncbi:MAG: SPOR domain-containing protein [Gemmatimonadota bacterium]